MSKQAEQQTSCIILSGGRANRMEGQDKGLVIYRGRPLIEHVLERIEPQVNQIVISANRNIERYSNYSDRVIPDQQTSFFGPLSGIASCLPHCVHSQVLVVACDMPNLPANLVTDLSKAINGHEVAIASCNESRQLALLLKSQLLVSINTAIAHGAHRFLEWVNLQDTVAVEYDNQLAFININTPDDLNGGY